MKKIIILVSSIVAAVAVIVTATVLIVVNLNKGDDDSKPDIIKVEEVITSITENDGNLDDVKYTLDKRFSGFKNFAVNGEGELSLNANNGILSFTFTTIEKEDGSVDCTIKELVIREYENTEETTITSIEEIKKLIGEDITFTLFLKDNSVTTDDLPVLINDESANMNSIFDTILQNTFALKEVMITYTNFTNNDGIKWYVEEGLIYNENIGKSKSFIYYEENKNYVLSSLSNIEYYSKELLEEEVDYNLGYYLKDKYNYEVKVEMMKYACVYGDFEGKTGYVFTNKDDVKIAVFVKENILEGFIIIDENGNVIEEYTITQGKKEYTLPEPIVVGSETLGENEELTLSAYYNGVSISYSVYDETDNDIYVIQAQSSSVLKYGETLVLNVTDVLGWDNAALGIFTTYIHSYYQESRTVELVLNEDQTFEVKHASLEEIKNWYEENVAVILAGHFGERTELSLDATEGDVYISYRVYNEAGENLYTITAFVTSPLKYDEPLCLNVESAVGWGSAITYDQVEMVSTYYQNPRTIEFVLNRDQSFEIKYTSLEEIQNWYEENIAVLVTDYFGEKDELYLSTSPSSIEILYHIYDDEGNSLYYLRASIDSPLKYGEAISLDVYDLAGWNGEYLPIDSTKIAAYYQEPRTVILTFNKDQTFEVQHATLEEIEDWYGDNVAVILSGFYGEKEELYILANINMIYVMYGVYNEVGELLYSIIASADTALVYGEKYILNINEASGWNGEVLGTNDIMFKNYYNEPRTIEFTFNKDQTFEVVMESYQEIIKWHEENIGVIRHDYYGEKEELYMVANVDDIYLAYRVYDEEGNELYTIQVESTDSIILGQTITIEVTSISELNTEVLGDNQVKLSKYYESPRTITFTYYEDDTFVLEYASLEEIIQWYDNQSV